ncbi:MAG: alpha-ketoglutarate-dependent dioxygenase AlkB [Xanthobacteraceae bacterium]
MASARKHQPGLFDAPRNLPEGFAYRDHLLIPAEERALVAWFADLPFREFEFGPYRGKRRVVSFGWKYDFTQSELQKADDMPAQLLPARESAANFAGLDPDELQHVLLTEYPAGAAIGWHKDKHMFGDVIGISLISACVFRFRRKSGAAWERAAIVAQPRSAYLLRGPARDQWEHSIPPVDGLRYSITFRSFRPDRAPSGRTRTSRRKVSSA